MPKHLSWNQWSVPVRHVEHGAAVVQELEEHVEYEARVEFVERPEFAWLHYVG